MAKTPSEIRAEVRASIPVVSNAGEGAETLVNGKTAAEIEAEAAATAAAAAEAGDDDADPDVDADPKDTLDENKETIKANEKTAEELEAEKAAATTQKEKDRVQRRIDRLTAKTTTLEKENAELKKQLAAQPDKTLTEAEVDARANKIADQRFTEREFVNACNKIAKDATAVDKEFKKKIDAVVDELGGLEAGGMPGYMVGILDDMDDGGKVLARIVNDIDEYEEIRALPMAKMATRLAKISTQIEAEEKAAAEAAKKKPKEPSKVPAAPDQLRGGSTTLPGTYRKGMSQEDYVAMRTKQKAEAAERRKAGLSA